MTKKKVIEKIQEVYDKLNNLEDTLVEARKEVRNAMIDIEEIPDEVSEIEDDDPVTEKE